MKTTQNSWVLTQLKAGAKLSSRDSCLEYGIQDLPKRISELRQQGHAIQSVICTGPSRFGKKCRWCEYWLEPDA